MGEAKRRQEQGLPPRPKKEEKKIQKSKEDQKSKENFKKDFNDKK